jgi:quercetin dioxygenase-like cupin family protein
MARTRYLIAVLSLAFSTIACSANGTVVTSLMTKELDDIAGKEAVMLVVEYPPGGIDAPHRHKAHAFIYVLEGTVVMQVGGSEEVTLRPGDTFYESPDDTHAVARNASQDLPAKFLVLFVKDKGVDFLLPIEGETNAAD